MAEIFLKSYNYQCNYCNKTFARKDNVYRHIKDSCKVAKQQNKEKKEIFDKLVALEEKNKELEEVIKSKDKYCEEEIKLINRLVCVSNSHLFLFPCCIDHYPFLIQNSFCI